MASQSTIDILLRRYGGATSELLDRVLTPHRLRLTKVWREAEGRRTRWLFTAEVPDTLLTTLEVGTTGKVVSRNHVDGTDAWGELVKGRVLSTDSPTQITGELYFNDGERLKAAIDLIKDGGDYLEIDPFGIASKVESALCEAAFFDQARAAGFAVTRMPENVAKHIGTQNYYDFKLERDGKTYRVELKSLWGTDTRKARLIHTVTKGDEGKGKNSKREDRQVWTTSSCRFKDQDIFAVSMWLRTGKVTDFAFALSVADDEHKDWGLPKVPDHPDHVTQNPPISNPPSGPWTSDLLEACRRVDEWDASPAKKKLSESAV